MENRLIFFLSFFIIICNSLFSADREKPGQNSQTIPDSIDNQILYNGRAWKNIYGRIQGNQFLFTNDFLSGTVTIENKHFDVPRLKYDIYNDQLLTVTDKGIIIQLNKEYTDRFDLEYLNKIYRFKRLDADSVRSLSGFVNVLYEGKISLFVKYRKSILLLAVDNKYDLFDQVQKMYLLKNGEIFFVKNRRSLLNLLKDQKQKVRSFIRTEKIKMSKLDPESFVPVVNYYDKLLH